MSITLVSQNKAFDGWQKRFKHHAESLNCQMHFSVYLPPVASVNQKVPVLYWLSGLTCSDENFVQKAGAQRLASELGVAIVCPDTSPRGSDVPDDPDGSYDFGHGAGFYVNAIKEPWSEHYQMYDYIVNELSGLIENKFPVTNQKSISGHSMGGHGALVIGLRNPGQYKSISAFSPVCNPVNCPWGEKAFSRYLGEDRQLWQQYDASCLLKQADQQIPILVDQGDQDQFLKDQLNPAALQQAGEFVQYPLSFNMRQGYDHSYFFIATFIDDHIRFHMEHLAGISDL